MKLPIEFLDKMKNLLGNEEYESFLKSYDAPRHYGLRANGLKINREVFKTISPFALEPVPWTSDGFYYAEGDNPGRHPHYHAGLYYIQEPSAMLPGAVVDARPGERVLDLCAAPGGKTVQMAAGMQGEGLLVANDISANRVKALVKNIELCGVRNAVVTNESPEKLACNFEGYFDKILVDAPCSGEGMFRKDRTAAQSWEKYKCEKCCGMQWDILQHADRMLKPGGCLVYSTCTFSPEEDERMISRFLDIFQTYELVEIPKMDGMTSGRPDWSDGNQDLAKTVRLWPHKLKGEGHFVARLRKEGTNAPVSVGFEKGEDAPKAFRDFIRENLNIEIKGIFMVKGDNLYCLPEQIPDLSGLKIAKFGWYLGRLKRERFEPSHSLILSLQQKAIKNVIDFSAGSKEILKYLKGETLIIPGTKGFVAVCVDGYTIGWAKQTGQMLKNLYPKGWRKA